jgi:hypothetical protein
LVPSRTRSSHSLSRPCHNEVGRGGIRKQRAAGLGQASWLCAAEQDLFSKVYVVRLAREQGQALWSGPLKRPARSCAQRSLGCKSTPLCVGRKRGEKSQAIGRSRGGRTTKIHAHPDAQCRPTAFLLTGSTVAHGDAVPALLQQLPIYEILHSDRGYDANAIPSRCLSAELCRTSRQRPAVVERPASLPSSIASATPSNACTAGCRTYVALPLATTETQPASSPRAASQRRSVTGYEIRPEVAKARPAAVLSDPLKVSARFRAEVRSRLVAMSCQTMVSPAHTVGEVYSSFYSVRSEPSLVLCREARLPCPASGRSRAGNHGATPGRSVRFARTLRDQGR